MNVVVIYESMRGHTRAAAEMIAGISLPAGIDVSVRDSTDLDFSELSAADLIFVGCWTDGLFFFGQKPGNAFKLKASIPVLDRKRVAVFCTYAVNPGKTAKKLGEMMEDKGAEIVATASLHRDLDADAVRDFVADALDAVPV